MTRRDMARQGTLAFGLIVGIVGGNFVLHRWLLGNAASREADAGTASTDLATEDLAEFAPTRRSAAEAVTPVEHRERLRRLVVENLPNASAEERDAWLEELSVVSLPAAQGILDLRDQVGAFPKIDATPKPQPEGTDSRIFNFSLSITR